MSDFESLRLDLIGVVQELRASLQDLGQDGAPQANVVADARDRLRYISALTEQSAGQTLNSVEAISDRLHQQKAWAELLLDKARSPEIRAFLRKVLDEHEKSGADVNEIIQAQAFQDLVGQVVNKLLLTVQKLEDNLAHLLVEADAEPEYLAGPALKREAAVSQQEVDSLFD